MSKLRLVLVVTGLCFAGAALGQGLTPVKVTGQRVNLRSKADLQSEVVGQVEDGEVLSAKTFQDEWVEVVPPESLDLWVYREFVKGNAVTGDKLYVRAGPGINYSVVGTLQRGTVVAPRGEFGEWLKIAPPPECSLWVSRTYVSSPVPPSAPVREAEVAAAPPPPSPVAVPAARVETVAPRPAVPVVEAAAEPAVTVITPTPRPAETESAALGDLKLVPLEGQGRTVQREGVLRMAGFVIGRPSRYRLVRYVGSRIETICYVRGNNAQLNQFLGHRMTVRGREFWVQGVRQPVVIPDQIVPLAAKSVLE